MFASINLRHKQITVDELRSALQDVYGVDGITGLPPIYSGTDADQQEEIMKDLVYAYRPSAKTSAYCFRHNDQVLEVHVEPADGGHLFRACEQTIRDLDGVFLNLTGVTPFGRRLPFTGKRTSLVSVDVNLASGYQSGMTGQATSFLKELRSHGTLRMIIPAALTIFAALVAGIWLGDDTEARIIFASISPASLVVFGIMSSFFAARRPIRWVEP
jgi:hypothetical protein